MRLKAEIWVKAYLRRCNAAGAFAVLVRHGDDDAGAIFITVAGRGGRVDLYGPAPAGLEVSSEERRWMLLMSTTSGPDAIAARLAAEARIDSDLWIVEVEDAEGRHFLGDELVPAL